MTKTVKVLAGLPGCGKTQAFIDSIDNSKRYVYVTPTRALAKEVMGRLGELHKRYQPIFTGQAGKIKSVIHQANLALDAKDSPILIITHKCLASVKPELLKGWELYIDEAPKVEQIDKATVLAKEWEQVIAPFVGDCDDDGHLLINDARLEEAWEIHVQGLEDAKNKRMRNKTLLMVLGAMLVPTQHATAVSGRSSKGKDVVRVSVEGFVDFTRCFDHANSVTLMGANIEKSLLISHTIKKGYTLDLVKDAHPRKHLPYIYPLVRDNEGAFISKRMLLTLPDGSVSPTWHPDCFGQRMLDRALELIGGRKAVFASHEWCQPDLPSNVERIPYDSRGLNGWKDRSISIHMIHGNPSPDELSPIKNVLEQMGIPLDEGRDALRWAREEDLILQHAFRTSLREEGNTEDTFHIVASTTQASRLAESLREGGPVAIVYDFAMEPPKAKPSEAKEGKDKEKEKLAKGIKLLKAQGLGQVAIAAKLGISQPKVCRLLKNTKL